MQCERATAHRFDRRDDGVGSVAIARYGLPTDISELDAHRLVHYVPSFGSKPDGWEYRDGNAFISRHMEGALTVNSAEA